MRALTHIKRITLSGLFMAFMVAMPAFASYYTDLYDIDGNYIDTGNDGVNGAFSNQYLYVNSYDRGCATVGYVSTSPASGSTIYSCNGGCTRFSSSTYKIVNIVPNGSNFYGYGPNADDTNGRYHFVCDVSGDWVALENEDTGGGSSGCSANTMLRTFVTLRNYCSDGYHDETLGDCNDFSGNVSDFIADPYGYWEHNYNNMFADHQQACTYNLYNSATGSTTKVNNYSGCASGYRLSNKSCISCGSLANGGYNAADWHTNTQCSPYCNDGYGLQLSTQQCVAGGANEYHMANYGGEENDYRACPTASGARCNGEYVYCPAGSFVFLEYSGAEPYCVDCPGQWGMVQLNYNNQLQDCQGVSGGYPYEEWGQGYADTTDCLWTDQVSDTPIDTCFEYMGSDNTGSYEYRQPDGGEWDFCYYE